MLISFFDTSFTDSEISVTNFEDGMAFYSDIIRLLKENPNYLALIKPSKDESFFVRENLQWASPVKGRKLVALFNVLKNINPDR